MRLRRVLNQVAGVLAAGVMLSSVGCSRNHIEAINLSNEGDRSFQTNVGAAISKYEQANLLDPTNHRILWKLVLAYERKEDWDKVASTASRGVQLVPEFANFWYKRGFALMQLARAGEKDRYEEAKEPLKKCIEADPRYAECYHELAEAYLWTDDVQQAVDNYSKSIEHGPSVGYFYPPLASLYITFRMYDEAEKVSSEATRILELTEDNIDHLHASYVLLAKVNQAKSNEAAMINALEKAAEIGGDKYPEDKFFLGDAYASKEPPDKEKAVRLLNSFSNTSCRGARAKEFKDYCQVSQDHIQRLGGSN